MLAQALRYGLQHPDRAMSALLRNPRGLWEKLLDRFVQDREYRRPAYALSAAHDWQRQLHAWLGVTWPSPLLDEFGQLWPAIVRRVRDAGIDVGPASFAGYNDGDTALARALFLLVRQMRPEAVIETGVGHGLSSRVILEAMQRNRKGHLHSIDLPPLDPATRGRVGIAVGSDFKGRWSLLRGSSRQELPPLLSGLHQIDLFVHDSLHTERNVRFELDRAWKKLRPGGVLVIDDIDSNGGYQSFLKTITGYRTLICEAEPLRPDTRRFNQKGLFAIVQKFV